jgi:hypothetical protein
MKDEIFKGIVGSTFFAFIGVVFILARGEVARHSFFWLDGNNPEEMKMPRKVVVIFGAIAIFMGLINLLLIAIKFISTSFR